MAIMYNIEGYQWYYVVGLLEGIFFETLAFLVCSATVGSLCVQSYHQDTLLSDFQKILNLFNKASYFDNKHSVICLQFF